MYLHNITTTALQHSLKCDFVSVPPHQMLLYDKSGADVSGIVGPLMEGSALVIVCEVRGGK